MKTKKETQSVVSGKKKSSENFVPTGRMAEFYRENKYPSLIVHDWKAVLR
jgi:hypothetical protein